MYSGKIVFSQVMDHLPMKEFRRCVDRYQGHHKVQSFSCLDQFLAMAFAQLTYRESLRDIEACLRAQQMKLYHMGIRSDVSRSTLAYANETRDWKIYADFAQVLISIARDLYAGDDFGVELKETVYALDSTTIDLCLSVFPWARFRKTKAAVKLHTLLDLRGSIPAFIRITDGKVHDVNILDEICPEPGSFYVMDRGYLDFEQLHRFHRAGAWFVIRAKSPLRTERRYSRPVDRAAGLVCDQSVLLAVRSSRVLYPDTLRRVRIKDRDSGKSLVFLTNNFVLSASTVGELYRCRWQVELFFRWIKQHLRIKAFFGTSENAVKTQVWIAIATYVLIAIVKKRLKLRASLYELLQILSLTMFERMPLDQLLTLTVPPATAPRSANQLILFE